MNKKFIGQCFADIQIHQCASMYKYEKYNHAIISKLHLPILLDKVFSLMNELSEVLETQKHYTSKRNIHLEESTSASFMPSAIYTHQMLQFKIFLLDITLSCVCCISLELLMIELVSSNKWSKVLCNLPTTYAVLRIIM